MESLPAAVTQLLEGSVDASVVLDESRRILYYNRAYEELSAQRGLRGRELKERVLGGAHCFEIFPLEVCAHACVGCRSRDVGRPLRVDEIRAQDTDEELTFIVTAVCLDNGYIIETYRDVTADVRIQRRLKILLERERQAKVILEEEVAERTRELRQAQAQLVLQEKMSALGRLVAGIAHELNNPINFVYGNVDFLSQYVEDLLSLVTLVDSHPALAEDLRRELERRKEEIEYDFLVADSSKLISSIRSGAERAASIVRDLKNFSRTGSGDRQATDLVKGIESTLNLIAPLIKNRIEIERHYPDDLPKLVCNAGHINQVFMNILTNAAQAIRGTGTIDISLAVVDESSLAVSIRDSGEGMSAEVVEKMFDPFFTTKEVGEGTGLGLWISQSIIKNHGGELRVESEPGVGSRFTMILPLATGEGGMGKGPSDG